MSSRSVSSPCLTESSKRKRAESTNSQSKKGILTVAVEKNNFRTKCLLLIKRLGFAEYVQRMIKKRYQGESTLRKDVFTKSEHTIRVIGPQHVCPQKFLSICPQIVNINSQKSEQKCCGPNTRIFVFTKCEHVFFQSKSWGARTVRPVSVSLNSVLGYNSLFFIGSQC